MARQRFIHPDIWSDPTLGQLKPVERLFFIGCFSSADDEGRLLGNPAYLRSTIFPYDDLTIEQVKEIREHVVLVCKNLMLYHVDGVEYLAFHKWSEYQKPKYPKKSKLPVPTPENIRETFPQNSGNDGESVDKGLLPRLGLGLNRDGFGLCLDRDVEQPDAAATTTIGELINVFEKEFGRPLSPMELESIAEMSDMDTPELAIEALRVAVQRNALSFKFIMSVLAGWRNKNIRTLREAQENEKQWAENKAKQQMERGSPNPEGGIANGTPVANHQPGPVATGKYPMRNGYDDPG
ncbi:MAG: DnaD domain-containing protein [Bacillota bacterium]